MEILMPFITAIIIDRGLGSRESPGRLPLWRAHGSHGVSEPDLRRLAGKNAAGAASGLSANLREAIYANIQTFRFPTSTSSVPSLVTRMTTDITNVQNAS